MGADPRHLPALYDELAQAERGNYPDGRGPNKAYITQIKEAIAEHERAARGTVEHAVDAAPEPVEEAPKGKARSQPAENADEKSATLENADG